jgi:hypothetical protein
MINRRTLLALSVVTLACSGGNDRQTNRNLGPGGRDAASDADEPEEDAEAEPVRDTGVGDDDAALALDAGADSGADASDARDASTSDAASMLDTGALDAQLDTSILQADSSAPDAAEADSALPDAAPDADDPPPGTFRIRVDIDNPHGHEEPIAYSWGGRSNVQADSDGYVYGVAAGDRLDIILGESDETRIIPILGVQSGDRLRVLYRHFREPAGWRMIALPTGALPAGADGVNAGDASFSLGQTIGDTRTYFVGPMSYLGLATQSAPPGILAYAFANDVPAGTSTAMLGAWLTPQPVTFDARNAPNDAETRLLLRAADGAEHEVGRNPAGSWVIPPGFAASVEARMWHVANESTDRERYVTRALVRCAADSVSELALDYADALPAPVATLTDLGGTLRWDLTTPTAAQGDLLIVDGVFMPASRGTIDLPDNGAGSHFVMRVDFASIADYAAFKRNIRLDLAGVQRDSEVLRTNWCQGTDYVRISQVFFQL